MVITLSFLSKNSSKKLNNALLFLLLINLKPLPSTPLFLFSSPRPVFANPLSHPWRN